MTTKSKEQPKPSRPQRVAAWMRENRTLAVLIALAMLIIATLVPVAFRLRSTAPVSAPQDAPKPPERPPYRPLQTATIRVFLKPYDDSGASLEQLRQLAPLLPRQQLEAEAGNLVANVVASEMRAPYANRPRTLSFLGSSASTENLSERVGTVPRGGRVYFPALPLVRPSWRGDRTIGATTFRVTDPGGTASFNELIATRFSETESMGTEGHLLDFRVDLPSLNRPEVQQLLRRDDVRLVQSPIRIAFGASSACPTPTASLLTAAQSGDIKVRLGAAKRDVDLFVLDATWPEPAYETSRARLFELFDRVRGLYDLEPAARADQDFTAVTYDHTDKILEALRPFTALDTGGRVRVTYVPMSLAQESKAVLRELLLLGTIIQMRSHFVGARHGALSNSERQAAEAFADAHVDGLPPEPGAVLYTDKFIFDALNNVVAEAAREDGQYYIANYSWTVEAGSMLDTPPAVRRGLGVVAAGNTETDVSTQGIDLARRGGEEDYYVTVMNFDEVNDLACNSSFLNAGILARSRAVGFSGRLGGVSATSFAAPRVAWLFALAEASRTAEPAGSWFSNFQGHLAAARVSGTGYKVLAIDPVTLAKIWP